MLRKGKTEPLSIMQKNLLGRSLIRKDRQRLSYGLQATGWGSVLGNALYKHQKRGIDVWGKPRKAFEDSQNLWSTASIWNAVRVSPYPVPLCHCAPITLMSLCRNWIGHIGQWWFTSDIFKLYFVAISMDTLWSNVERRSNFSPHSKLPHVL